MPDGGRKLRNLRATDAIRAFERLGYAVSRTRGSHHVLKHASGRILVIPLHGGRVNVGIIMDALKKAGISVEHFEQQL